MAIIAKSKQFDTLNNADCPIVCSNMNNNGIRELQDDSFKNLKNLHELKLNHNRLDALPNELFSNLRKLKRL